MGLIATAAAAGIISAIGGILFTTVKAEIEISQEKKEEEIVDYSNLSQEEKDKKIKEILTNLGYEVK